MQNDEKYITWSFGAGELTRYQSKAGMILLNEM